LKSLIGKQEEIILKDTVKNITKIAAQALSETINKKIELSEPRIKIISIKDLQKDFYPYEEHPIAVWMFLKNQTTNTILLMSKEENFLKIADILLHKEIGYYKGLSNENISVIKQICELIAGYFIDAEIKLFAENLEFKKTEVSVNPSKAVEYFGFKDVYSQTFLVLETLIKIKEYDLEIKIFLIFKSSMKDRIIELILENQHLISV